MDHWLLIALLDVKITLSPAQKVVGPLTVTVGVAGLGRTVTTLGNEVLVQPKIFVRLTVNEPELNTLMERVVAPVFHKLPVIALLVNVTLSPRQKFTGPLEAIVGMGGLGLILTTTAFDCTETQVPLSTYNVYVPETDTRIESVVAPLDQMLPVGLLDVKTKFCPAQIWCGPFGEIPGGGGVRFWVVIGAEVEVQPLISVWETVKIPDESTLMDCVVSPVDQRIPVETFEVKITLSPSQKINDPVTEITGTAGRGLIAIETVAEVSEIQFNAEY